MLAIFAEDHTVTIWISDNWFQSKIVQQNLDEFWEDLELDFKVFFFVDSGSAYIVLVKSE